MSATSAATLATGHMLANPVRRHVLGGLGEHAVDRRTEVGVLVDDRRDEQPVRGARVDQRLPRDLDLAAAEVVVQRADRAPEAAAMSFMPTPA